MTFTNTVERVDLQCNLSTKEKIDIFLKSYLDKKVKKKSLISSYQTCKCKIPLHCGLDK